MIDLDFLLFYLSHSAKCWLSFRNINKLAWWKPHWLFLNYIWSCTEYLISWCWCCCDMQICSARSQTSDYFVQFSSHHFNGPLYSSVVAKNVIFALSLKHSSYFQILSWIASSGVIASSLSDEMQWTMIVTFNLEVIFFVTLFFLAFAADSAISSHYFCQQGYK